MMSCKICNAQFEHKLEGVEHRSSLSHQIRIGSTLKKGAKRFCPACSVSCQDLGAYSKHVDSDTHTKKMQALRSKRMTMVYSSGPSKNNPQSGSPASRPVNLATPSPLSDPNQSSSFPRPSVHTERSPHNSQLDEIARGGDDSTPIFRQHMYQELSNEEWRMRRQRGGRKKKKKKKIEEAIPKVQSSSVIVNKKKKIIVPTPIAPSLDDKRKRYESLALKGAVVSTNKSRTQALLMERQSKYSLVDGQGLSIDESRRNVSSPSIPSIGDPPVCSPPHLLPPLSPLQPTLHPSPIHISARVKEEVREEEEGTVLRTTIKKDPPSDQTLSVDSLNQKINEKNSKRKMELVEQKRKNVCVSVPITVSPTSPPLSLQPTPHPSPHLPSPRVKEEVREEEEIIFVNQDSPSDKTLQMDSLNQKINEKNEKRKMEYDDQNRKNESVIVDDGKSKEFLLAKISELGGELARSKAENELKDQEIKILKEEIGKLKEERTGINIKNGDRGEHRMMH